MKKIILAPIRGVTNYIYRNNFVKYFNDVDYAMSPFITITGGQGIKEKTLSDILPEKQMMKLVPQIIGNRPDDLVRLTNACADLGYTEVNLNMGCPHKMVAKKKRGSGLLAFPELVDDILGKVFERIDIDFSVKVRLGYKNKNELEGIIPILNKYPLKNVTIHPRTGLQMYEGNASIEDFEKLYKMINHEIIFNGDVYTKKDYYTIEKKFSDIKQVMIGRGLLADPTLGMQIKGGKINADEKRKLLYNFHRGIYYENKMILSGDRSLLGRMKEFWYYLSHSFDNWKKVLKSIQKTNRAADYEDLIERIFNEEDIVIEHTFRG